MLYRKLSGYVPAFVDLHNRHVWTSTLQFLAVGQMPETVSHGFAGFFILLSCREISHSVIWAGACVTPTGLRPCDTNRASAICGWIVGPIPFVSLCLSDWRTPSDMTRRDHNCLGRKCRTVQSGDRCWECCSEHRALSSHQDFVHFAFLPRQTKARG